MKLGEVLNVINTGVSIYKGNQTVAEDVDAFYNRGSDSPIGDYLGDQVEEITQRINNEDDGCIVIYLEEGRK